MSILFFETAGEKIMGIPELALIGVGLAMDAFAVSICKGLSMRKMNYGHAGIIALFFGAFQAMMPFIGFMVAKTFAKYVEQFDHWVAFVLLVLIGGKMIYDVFTEGEDAVEIHEEDKLNYTELVLLAVATSIDALAVGVSFAFLHVEIFSAITIIGVLTLFISFGGVVIGNVFGNRYEKGAQLAGGIILILLGTKILLEHLGIL